MVGTGNIDEKNPDCGDGDATTTIGEGELEFESIFNCASASVGVPSCVPCIVRGEGIGDEIVYCFECNPLFKRNPNVESEDAIVVVEYSGIEYNYFDLDS